MLLSRIRSGASPTWVQNTHSVSPRSSTAEWRMSGLNSSGPSSKFVKPSADR